jgi:hypothetical protein
MHTQHSTLPSLTACSDFGHARVAQTAEEGGCRLETRDKKIAKILQIPLNRGKIGV